MILKEFFVYIFILLCVTYGQFYHHYKFSDPNLGNNDYFYYKEMVQSPFNINATGSPFVYRQLTTSIAKCIFDLHIFYDSKINYKCDKLEQQIYFSLLFSNYIGIFLCLLSLILYLVKFYGLKSIDILFFPILLITTSFGYIFNGLSVLTEGWTYFFNLIIFFTFIKNKFLPFFILTSISIFNKEISVIFIILFISAILLHDLIFDKKIMIHRLKYLAISIFIFFLYLYFRKTILFAPGHENQLKPNIWLDNITNFNFNFSFLFQGVLSIGVFGILILVVFNKKKANLFYNDKYLFGISLTIFLLYLIGIATAIGTNIGRIISSITPVISFLIIYIIYAEKRKNLLF